MWIGQFSLVVLFHMMIQGSRLLPSSDAAVFNRELLLSLKKEKREHGQCAEDFVARLRNGTLSLLPTFYWPEPGHMPQRNHKGGWEM